MLSSCIFIILLFGSCERTSQTAVQESQASNRQNLQSVNFTAKVIRIIDGDTLEVMYGELPVMIRMAHIDCPEKQGGQPFGQKAKQTLSDLCFGQNIEVEFAGDKDRNGRYVCVIYNQEGTNLNKEMVSRGMAWHYKKYSADNVYAELENNARKNKTGLWQDSNPVPPWEWRK